MTRNDGRLASLDGLRALSISAVLLGHLAGTRRFPAFLTSVIHNDRVDIAAIGVGVFFVISGFLITGLLIAEHERSGTISLPRFYLRRTLRIFPAYFVYLAVVALLNARGVVDVSRSDFVHAVTYTMNYAPHRGWQLGHFWSLATEEQFYLLWPAVVLLAAPRRAFRVAVAVVCLAPLVRLAEGAMLGHAAGDYVGTTFETTADTIAIGCVLALSRDALWSRPRYRWAVETPWVAPLLLVLAVLIGLRYRPGILLGTTLASIAFMLVIDRSVRLPKSRFGLILNSPILVYVGTLSYSIYLWQQLFLNRSSTSVLTMFPLNIVFALMAAAASYYLVERPFLRLRPRLEARWIGQPTPVTTPRLEPASGT